MSRRFTVNRWWWRTVATAGVLAAVLGGSKMALAAAGDLDPTFSVDGRVVTSFADDDLAYAVLVQPDGRIVAAGSTFTNFTYGSKFAVARYNPDGSLDASFAGDGRVVVSVGVSSQVYGAVLQADGKIVLAGSTSDPWTGVPERFALARLLPSGALDPSFDGDGIVITPVGSFAEAYAVALQPDGKIVAAGHSGGADIAVVRYNADGSLDTSFDGDGKYVWAAAGYDKGTDVVIQPDGQILVGGTVDQYGATDFLVLRLSPAGALNGLFRVNFGSYSYDFANAIALQADGKILLAGLSGGIGTSQFALARLNPNGTLDPTFDGDGRLTTDFGAEESVEDLLVQPDGRIVAVGWKKIYPPEFYGFDDVSDFALARYNADGSLDASFGIGGKLTTDMPGTALYRNNHAKSAALQPDGKLVVAGDTNDIPGFFVHLWPDFALARYDGGRRRTRMGTGSPIRMTIAC